MATTNMQGARCDEREAQIDETLVESFPASDPPNWTLGREPEHVEGHHTHPPASTARGAVFDLAAIDGELRTEKAYARDGHTGRTLVREPDLRVVVLTMQAGGRLLEHRADETASIHTLTGHVRLHVLDRVVDLPAGRLLVLERGLRHDVEAVRDSTVLLTIGWRE